MQITCAHSLVIPCALAALESDVRRHTTQERRVVAHQECVLVGHKHLREDALDGGVVANERDVRDIPACLVTRHALTCAEPVHIEDAAPPTTLKEAHGRVIHIETHGALAVGACW